MAKAGKAPTLTARKAHFDHFVEAMDLEEVEQGANLVFLDPYYKYSVFYDRQEVKGLQVVSDLQLYLDLYHYPLRGREQAEHLYEKRLRDMIEVMDQRPLNAFPALI